MGHPIICQAIEFIFAYFNIYVINAQFLMLNGSTCWYHYLKTSPKIRMDYIMDGNVAYGCALDHCTVMRT